MIQCKAEQQSNHESGGFVLPFFYLPKGSVGGMQWQRNEYLKFFSLLFLHSFGVNKIEIVNERKLWDTTENAVNEQNGQLASKILKGL